MLSLWLDLLLGLWLELPLGLWLSLLLGLGLDLLLGERLLGLWLVLVLGAHRLATLLGEELTRLPARGHLVGLLGLAIGWLHLARNLLGCDTRYTLRARLRRVLLGQSGLLVDLPLLLLTLLLVLLGLLNELSGLWIARLQFRLDRLVLAECFRMACVRRALDGAMALLALESLLGCLLALLGLPL